MTREAAAWLSVSAVLIALGAGCDSGHMVGVVLGSGGQAGGAVSDGGATGGGSGSGGSGRGGSPGSGGVVGGGGAGTGGRSAGTGGRSAGTGGSGGGGGAAAAGSGGRAAAGGAGGGAAGVSGSGGATTGTGGGAAGTGGAGGGGQGGAGGEIRCSNGSPNCPAGMVCDEGQRACGFSATLGFCRPRPTSCPATGTPVCVCEANTYANDCLRMMAGETRYDHTGSCGTGGSSASAQSCSSVPPDTCPSGTACRCYQSGPIQLTCYCTTACAGDGECTDPGRPRCGGCDPLQCLPADAPGPCCGCDCAAPDTPVATPAGERAIASLGPGDLVISLHHGRLVPVPILRASRVRQVDHHVVEVVLDSGARLEISEGHPTADGRTFADLAPGERLGDARIVSLRSIPYRHGYTHDILPASDSGSYLAGGALIGSTLAPPLARAAR